MELTASQQPLQVDQTDDFKVFERDFVYPSKHRTTRYAWVERLDDLPERKVGIIPLHPTIFATSPRIDILHDNVRWQQRYKSVNWAWLPTRAEVKGGGHKPWPQKGTGRARHGSNRSPIFMGGGVVRGPRGPQSNYYMLPPSMRELGLRVALSIKLAQDDLHVVESLDMPSDDASFLEALSVERNWGLSVLFIDATDVMPRNISIAAWELPTFTLMPVYGLNVYSMMKYETLVLTVAAVKRIEERILAFRNSLYYVQPDIDRIVQKDATRQPRIEFHH